MNKKAILLVTTGSSKKEALNLTVEKLALEIKEKFPAYVFYLAISSAHIRNKMQMLCEDKILDIEGAFFTDEGRWYTGGVYPVNLFIEWTGK